MLSYGAWAGAAICRGPVRARPPSSIPHLGARRLSLLLVCAVTPLVTLVGLEGWGRSPDRFTLVGIGSAGLVIWVLVGVRGAALISIGRALATAQGNERFAAMVENATDVVITIDAEEEITYASPSVLTLWGFDPADLIGRRFADVTDPDDAGSVRRQLQNAVGIPSRSTVSFQTRVPRKHGGVCTCAAVAANLTDHAGVDGVVITLRDITAELALEHQLRAKAFNDELTGLANRALFMDRVEHALRLRDASSHREVAVLALDIDDFKHINEGLGHSAGDELLVAVGCRLTECVRPGDTVARLGADEFAILLQGGTGRTESLQFAARIDEVIDDFGTGYSSLAYLQRFPVDTLKIDQAFVAEIEADSVNLLAHTIVRLASTLEIPAIAEGIEHLGQLENLARHGCTAGQGFYLARPMSAEALTTLVVRSDGMIPLHAACAPNPTRSS